MSRVIVIGLPIDVYTLDEATEINGKEFSSVEGALNSLKNPDVEWDSIAEYLRLINEDKIDTENNWFAYVCIL